MHEWHGSKDSGGLQDGVSLLVSIQFTYGDEGCDRLTGSVGEDEELRGKSQALRDPWQELHSGKPPMARVQKVGAACLGREFAQGRPVVPRPTANGNGVTWVSPGCQQKMTECGAYRGVALRANEHRKEGGQERSKAEGEREGCR